MVTFGLGGLVGRLLPINFGNFASRPPRPKETMGKIEVFKPALF